MFDESDETAPVETQQQIESSLARDYFHDIGLYRGRDFNTAVDNLKAIVNSKKIRGGTEKGAQVSQNHGPTNWESPLSLRISGNIANIGPDTNAPDYANWYGTASRYTPIDLRGTQMEVVVNGNSPKEIEERMRIVRERLDGENVAVTSVEDLLHERFSNIALDFENEDTKNEFLEKVGAMNLGEKKGLAEMLTERVGTMIAKHYPHLPAKERSIYLDFETARAIESLIPESFEKAHADLEKNSKQSAADFYNSLQGKPYLEQLDLGLRSLENPQVLRELAATA